MQQLNLQGKTKEELAVEFIREHEPPEGYFLGFSGGKDSVVLYDLTEKSGVKFQSYYSATGIDPPELVKFIRKNYLDVIWKHPNYKGHKSFFSMIPIRNFPTKFARWCCDDLKKNPTKDVPLKHRLMGIRAEESNKRAKRGEISNLKKWIIYKPIFKWLEWEVWDHINKNNLPYCSLYNEGFSRLGCVVCPFLCNPNQRILNKHKERWPKIYTAFEKAMRKLFDNYLCVINPRSGAWNYKRETDFDEFIKNWYRGK